MPRSIREVDMTDREVLARTMWGEARGEGRIGQEAVASVILNRVELAKAFKARKGRNHPLYGDGTVEGACRAPWQFSCWNENDPNLPKLLAVTMDDRRFSSCMAVAAVALSGVLDDPTQGATHYHTVKSPPNVKQWPPKWAASLTPTVTIGAHIFYR